jgi:riboflavin synthase
MFTGLIEEVGRILWIRAGERGVELEIAATEVSEKIRTGDSIAVNGCCLTVTAHRAGQITFDLLGETLERTNLKSLRRDSLINLERPLRADSRLGGHFVQGHVDCVSEVLAFEPVAKDYRLTVRLPREFARFVACKGSIAVNGISLTVAEVAPETFTLWIIPHTRQATNLREIEKGALVNLEFDILAKYVERMIQPNNTLGHT